MIRKEDYHPTYQQIVMAEVIDAHRSGLKEEGMLLKLKQMGPDFYHEFATLNLSFGRASGHTTFIQQNARPNDIIIVYNEFMRECFIRNGQLSFDRNHIVTVNELDRKARGIKFDKPIIWIDGQRVYHTVLESKNIADYIGFIERVCPVEIIVLGE